ncbi:MAG: RNA polymerase subunit sigma-70 [Clostridia bacterium]|nr:RNA polymerase subunit sigma-70 [Clostridia bacterium]
MLFEQYSSLLTDRQRELVKLYYFEDLSLQEIADELGITRQAVFFGLKRAQKALEGYENSLGLVERFSYLKKNLRGIIGHLDNFRDSGDSVELDKIDKMLVDLLDFEFNFRDSSKIGGE